MFGAKSLLEPKMILIVNWNAGKKTSVDRAPGVEHFTFYEDWFPIFNTLRPNRIYMLGHTQAQKRLT